MLSLWLRPAWPVTVIVAVTAAPIVLIALWWGVRGRRLATEQERARVARDLHDGLGSRLTPSIARKVILHLQGAPEPQPKSAPPELTKRERTILVHVSQGKTSKEIRAELGIETSAVSLHMRNVYRKLHVRNRTEAVVKFLGR